MDSPTSVGVTCFWYFERSLIMWYRFQIKREMFKITIHFITSGEDRKLRPTPLTLLCTSTRWYLSSLKVWWLYLLTFLRKRVDMKKRKSAVSRDWKWIFKKQKNHIEFIFLKVDPVNLKDIYWDISEKSSGQKWGK